MTDYAGFSPYPLVFRNILKAKIWGGSKISNLFKSKVENITSDNNIGEAWSLVDRNDDQSIVQNGPLQGLTLKELRVKYGSSIFGETVDCSKPFHILVKIIDANDDLSLQVHPKTNDISLLPGLAESKTEMWYVLDHDKHSKIFAGFNQGVKLSQISSCLKAKSNDLINLVQSYEAQKDKGYFIESGTVHAIGKGNLLLEIQQNSDTTYRIYDWNRADLNGSMREIHLKQAVTVLKTSYNHKIYTCDFIKGKEEYINKAMSPKGFIVNIYHSHINQAIDYKVSKDECRGLTAVGKNKIKITTQGNSVILSQGQTALLPANATYSISPAVNNESCYFLTYI